MVAGPFMESLRMGTAVLEQTGRVCTRKWPRTSTGFTRRWVKIVHLAIGTSLNLAQGTGAYLVRKQAALLYLKKIKQEVNYVFLLVLRRVSGQKTSLQWDPRLHRGRWEWRERAQLHDVPYKQPLPDPELIF